MTAEQTDEMRAIWLITREAQELETPKRTAAIGASDAVLRLLNERDALLGSLRWIASLYPEDDPNVVALEAREAIAKAEAP